MREIEFRFWNTIARKFERSDKYCIDGEGLLIAFNFETFEYDNPVSFDKTCIIAQQYTGLKDKNGKKIFEGDILSRTWFWFNKSHVEGEYVTDIKVVEWDAYKGYGFRENEIPMGWKWEIVGNIFETPELI